MATGDNMTTTVSEEDTTETVDVEEALKLDGNDSPGVTKKIVYL